jgi:hypothetical protein
VDSKVGFAWVRAVHGGRDVSMVYESSVEIGNQGLKIGEYRLRYSIICDKRVEGDHGRKGLWNAPKRSGDVARIRMVSEHGESGVESRTRTRVIISHMKKSRAATYGSVGGPLAFKGVREVVFP